MEEKMYAAPGINGLPGQSPIQNSKEAARLVSLFKFVPLSP